MRFVNLEPPYEPSPLADVLRWALWDRLTGRRVVAPGRCVMPRATPDRALLASRSPSLTWVGHASWIARLDGLTLFIDPIWSRSLGPGVQRNVEPGVALGEAPLPDAVLITHSHRDHLDEPTLRRLDRLPGARHTYLCGEGLGPFFRQLGTRPVIELPWWGEHTLTGTGTGPDGAPGRVTVAFVPSQHWSQRGPLDRNASLWGGFVLTGGGRRFYHAGDTAWFSGFREIGRRFRDIDAAMLPIGAYQPDWFMRRQHLNPEDAVRAFLDLRAQTLCAMHWGTFKLTDEPLDEPPRFLEEVRRREGVPPERVWVAAIGETRGF